MKKQALLSRRSFLTSAGLSLAATTLPSFSWDIQKREPLIIGLCGGLENSELAKFAGCRYIEETVGKLLMPTKTESEFRVQQQSIKLLQPLPITCCNVFLPRELKSVGEQADHEAIINYATIAMKRAEILGVKIIVFGSSGSRTIPDGFDRAKAKAQFISLCQSLAPVAARHKITLAVEPLNKAETNFINTMQEAAEIVEAVKHPALKMMCDIYHALRENDPASEIIRLKKYIVHCHIAEKEERTAPGVKGDDFSPYLRALRKIKYTGRVSLECKWGNMKEELPTAVRVIQEQFAKA